MNPRGLILDTLRYDYRMYKGTTGRDFKEPETKIVKTQFQLSYRNRTIFRFQSIRKQNLNFLFLFQILVPVCTRTSYIIYGSQNRYFKMLFRLNGTNDSVPVSSQKIWFRSHLVSSWIIWLYISRDRTDQNTVRQNLMWWFQFISCLASHNFWFWLLYSFSLQIFMISAN